MEIKGAIMGFLGSFLGAFLPTTPDDLGGGISLSPMMTLS
jgi:hypothetical protein